MSSVNPFTLRVHPIKAKNIVNTRPELVSGVTSPNPTVLMVTADWKKIKRNNWKLIYNISANMYIYIRIRHIHTYINLTHMNTFIYLR